MNRADETVQNAYKNSRDGIVVLPDYMPWKNGLYKTDALFVVYPSQRGGYSAQCVTDYKTRRSKVPFPPAWGGQPEEILRERAAWLSSSATPAVSLSPRKPKRMPLRHAAVPCAPPEGR